MALLYRLSGAGNDFLALPLVGEATKLSAAHDPGTIRRWCRRGLALGADGLFTLERAVHGVRMVHFNADGSRGELCLNGSRCAVQLAHHLGWHRDDALTLITDAGALAGHRIDAATVALELPDTLETPTPRRLEAEGRGWDVWTVRVGVPHVVLPWPTTLATAPVASLGAALRSHPDLGSEGANVNFVRLGEEGTAEGHSFEIRTFERGVEAETLACGTGAVATAAAGVDTGRLRPPVTAYTAGGFKLGVEGTVAEGRLENVTLRGDARIVARLEPTAQALALPRPASWRP